MGTIGTVGGYYPLSSLLSSGSGGSSSSTLSASSLEATLAQALFSSNSGSSQTGSNAYLLDLSPQAQQLLGGNTSAASSGSGSSTHFTLTQAQETAIEKILAKYKNAPLDQATFDAIQNDLQAARLSPQTLGAEDQISSFNPTNELLDALNGTYSNLQTPSTSASAEQTKEGNYLQSIVSLWKDESSSAGGSSGANAVSSASGSSL